MKLLPPYVMYAPPSRTLRAGADGDGAGLPRPRCPVDPKPTLPAPGTASWMESAAMSNLPPVSLVHTVLRDLVSLARGAGLLPDHRGGRPLPRRRAA